MKRELIWTAHALRDLERLDEANQSRILEALDAYAETGSGPDQEARRDKR